MSGAVPFRNLSTSDFLRRFGHQAQTSQFRAVLQVGTLPFTKNYDPQGGRFYDDLSFLCNSTSLPGSSFSTTENLQDYYGVNQKFAYRRDFDDLSLDFYVDAKYQTLKFFEQWMDFISSPNGNGNYSVVTNSDPSSDISFYRFKYPREKGGYKCRIDLHKFDKDYDRTKNDILYSFVNAFPRSLSSIPISYDGSSLLKCSVTFVYDRYFVNRGGSIQEANDIVDTTTPANNPSASGPSDTQATKSTKPFDSFGSTNGSSSDFAERDTATGARMDGGSDGPLLLPDGSPAYDVNGNLRSMF